MEHAMTLTGTRHVLFKRTNQFSECEREQFRSLFRRVFEKELSGDEFERKYTQTPLGYSHHGLMLAEGKVVGAYSLVPYRYRYFGEERLFGLSVDAMVDREHRAGPFNLANMARCVYEEAARDGVVFAFGFPNDQAYLFTRRILKWTDMGDLEFYAIPINIGALHSSLAWANPLSRLCAAVLTHMPRRSATTPVMFPIEKVRDEAFHAHRYDEQHGVLRLRHGEDCIYRCYKEDNGARVLYIIDVAPLTAAGFAEAVGRLHGLAASCADLMLYVGRLPFGFQGMFRLPASRRPRRIRMCGKILAPESIDQRVFQIQHWNINISNFDVR